MRAVWRGGVCLIGDRWMISAFPEPVTVLARPYVLRHGGQAWLLRPGSDHGVTIFVITAHVVPIYTLPIYTENQLGQPWELS